MRFIQFTQNGQCSVGIELKDGIVDLHAASAGQIPTTLIGFLEGGAPLMSWARKIVADKSQQLIPFSDVKLLSPVTRPDKVICVGNNYRDHCEEQGVPIPEEPVIFSKFGSSITGPYDDIPYPSNTQELDWEVELAVIIGKGGENIDEEEAMSHVFGYTVAHDVSARDWQLKKNGGQWLLGKTMKGFCPLGPAIVTTDELLDPHNLSLSLKVNGETKQDSSTNQIIHKVPAVISFISRFCALYPGDVILTGTPPGVGVFRKPPVFLQVGDEVECCIEGIGSIKNRISS